MATYLITGANRGIGLELCRQAAAAGHDSVGVCRRISPELDRLGIRVQAGVDVTDDASVNDLARRLDGTQLDVLIHNAGILVRDSLEDLDLASVLRQFEVNSLGPLRVTRALLPHLAQGSKIAIITSLMGSLADNGSGGYYGYRMSKAAVNMAGVSLARDLAGRGIAVGIFHPGMVRTAMTGHRGVPVQEAARGLLEGIGRLGLEGSGTFRHADGSPLPW